MLRLSRILHGTTSSLPVIDLAPLWQGSGPAFLATESMLVRACEQQSACIVQVCVWRHKKN
jgi:hypothetical protein